MDDHPARDALLNMLGAAVFAGIVIGIMAAIPCIVWLWKWAL